MGNITLQLKDEQLDFLHRIIREHNAFIHTLKIGDLLKKELLKDMSKITITLQNAEKGATHGERTAVNNAGS
jgi:hypothetical protein